MTETDEELMKELCRTVEGWTWSPVDHDTVEMGGIRSSKAEYLS